MSRLLGSVSGDISALANQPAPVILGPLTLLGAEAPSRITIGGKQLVAVHKLPGGARIIDAMGPDDSAVVWQGVFIGPTAASRVRLVDALRSGGKSCTLAFGDYMFDVIVVAFQYSYESRGAVISYKLRAERTNTVFATTAPTAVEAALSDCSVATQLLTNTQATLAAYGGTTGGLSGSTSLILTGLASAVDASGSSLSTDTSIGVQSQIAATLSPASTAIQSAIPLLSVGNLAGVAAPLSVSTGSAMISLVQNAGALAATVGAGGFINRANVGLSVSDAETVSIGVYS